MEGFCLLFYGVFCSKVTKFVLALDMLSSSESNSESSCDSEDSEASSESNFDIELEDEEWKSRVSRCESSEEWLVLTNLWLMRNG